MNTDELRKLLAVAEAAPTTQSAAWISAGTVAAILRELIEARETITALESRARTAPRYGDRVRQIDEWDVRVVLAVGKRVAWRYEGNEHVFRDRLEDWQKSMCNAAVLKRGDDK